MAGGRNRAAGEAGFTLLELLVALSVLAVLMALMFGGLRFGSRVWERGDASLRGLAELQTASNFIRRAIAQSVPKSLPAQSGDVRFDGGAQPEAAEPGSDEAALAFRGRPDALRLVTLAPSQLLPGGLYEIALGLDGGGRGGYRLSAWFRPLDRSGSAPSTLDRDARTRQVVLLTGVADVRLRYFGQGDDFDEPPQWHERWEDMLARPNLVSMRVDFPPGDARMWPELIVAPVASGGYQ